MFSTEQGTALFHKLQPGIINAINLLDNLRFAQCDAELTEMQTIIDSHSSDWSNERDDVLNEVYVLNRFVDLLESYSATWMNITDAKFVNSWGSLQGSMDHLRLIKKVSNGTGSHMIEFFENQLVELEKLYPYNVFFSMGAKVEWFECSICGKDIDSLECEHIKGGLYRGRMAYGTAKNIAYIDHVALVKYPQDKRCVVQYDDDGPQFKVVRYVSNLVTSKTMSPLSFHHLEFSKRLEKNPDFKRLPRNEMCYCGSGKKYKKCCIDKEYIEGDHVEIVTRITEPAEIFS